jgi:hypothetical protein
MFTAMVFSSEQQRCPGRFEETTPVLCELVGTSAERMFALLSRVCAHPGFLEDAEDGRIGIYFGGDSATVVFEGRPRHRGWLLELLHSHAGDFDIRVKPRH